MALQLPNGIPLNPKKPVWAGPLFDPMDVTHPPAPPPFEVLDIDDVRQEGKDWCWAASMTMVLDYYKHPVTQCDIVRRIFGLGTELCAKTREQKTESCDPNKMEAVWKEFHIKSVVSMIGSLGTPSQITFKDIQDEIRKKRPVQIGIAYWKNGAHSLIVTGFSTTLPARVCVNDPLLGRGSLSYDELKTYNSQGQWVHTWCEIKP